MNVLKKPLSILLSLIMIFSVFTIVPFSASAEAATDVVYLGFTSDVHAQTDYLQAWLNAVTGTYHLDSMTYCGDYGSHQNGADAYKVAFDTIYAKNNTLKENNKIDSVVYTGGNHDYQYSGVYDYITGVAGDEFKHNAEANVGADAGYRVYCIGADNYNSNSNYSFSNEDINALTSYLSSAPSDVPIFVASHFPLHYLVSGSTTRAIGNADQVISALNNSGKNIIFIWGHNHSQADPMYGTVLKAGDSIKYSSSASTAINFTYAAAGGLRGEVADGEVNYSGLVTSVDPVGQNVTFRYYQRSTGAAIGDPVTVSYGGTAPTESTVYERVDALTDGDYLIVDETYNYALNNLTDSGDPSKTTAGGSYKNYQAVQIDTVNSQKQITVNAADAPKLTWTFMPKVISSNTLRYAIYNKESARFLYSDHVKNSYSHVTSDQATQSWTYASSMLTCDNSYSDHIYYTYGTGKDEFRLYDSSHNVFLYKKVVDTVTSSAGDHGSIYPNGTLAVNNGEKLTYTVTPDTGYVIDQVTVDGEAVALTDGKFTLTATGSHTVEATFTDVTYNVTWLDYDGTELAKSTVGAGATPVYPGDKDPARDSEGNIRYEFTGWTPELAPATGDATYTATYEQHTFYVITWYDEDGTLLDTSEVDEGETPVYPGETPTKADDAEYHYTFSGWTPVLARADADASYTATYSQTRYYTITWENYDGSVLATDQVDENATPAYTGATPVRPSDGQFDYTFSGWTPSIAAATADATYTATYSQTAAEVTPVYKRVSSLTNGHDYLIVSAASGSGYALKNNNGTVARNGNTALTISGTGNNASIETDDSTLVWTADTFGSGFSLKNTSNNSTRYLTASSNSLSLAASTTSNRYWTYSSTNNNSRLGYRYSSTATYYLRYSSNNFSASTTQSNIYLYERYYKLSAFAGEGGSVGNSVEVTKGSNSTITYSPNSGYKVDKVYIDGVALETTPASSYTFSNVSDNHTIYVTFKPIVTYTITANADTGSTITSDSGSFTVDEDDDFTFTVAVDDDYDLEAVLIDDESQEFSANGKYTIANVRADHTVSTSCKEKPIYTVTASAGKGGSISPEGETSVHRDASVEFTVTPDTGFDVAAVYAGDTELTPGSNGKYTVTVTEDVAVTATFAKVAYILTDTLAKDNDYLIVSANSGSAVAVKKPATEGEDAAIGTGNVTIADDNTISNPDADLIWSCVEHTDKDSNSGVALRAKTHTSNYYYLKMQTGSNPVVIDSANARLWAYTDGGNLNYHKSSTSELELLYNSTAGTFGGTTGTSVYIFKKVNLFEVTFADEDGSVLQSTYVPAGNTPEYKGETPSKEATAQYTYTFEGWDKEITPATGEVTYTAVYSASLNKYTVKFLDADGTELQKDSISYGETPVFEGEEPTKAEDYDYTYTFAGWDNEIVAVTGDATYTATYTPEAKYAEGYYLVGIDNDWTTLNPDYLFTVNPDDADEYIITDLDLDTTYGMKVVKYTRGNNGDFEWYPTGVDNNYFVPAEGIYDMHFRDDGLGGEGWHQGYLRAVNVTPYDVTWQNYDGTELYVSSKVLYGEQPTYEGDDPTRGADAQYTYTFDGWTVKDTETPVYTAATIPAVTGEVTYVAHYSTTVNEYTITWKNEDGTVIDTTKVAYGSTPNHADAEKAATAQYTYTFAGWTPAIVPVTGNAEYTAQFTSTVNEYDITWKNDDGSVIETTKVAYGSTPTHADAEKAATAQYTYTFAGWTPAITAVTGNAEYTAQFTPVLRSYTIKFVNDDDTELQSSSVAYDETPVYTGDEPTKAADDDYTYTFNGWDSEIVPVTGEATYKATYTATAKYAAGYYLIGSMTSWKVDPAYKLSINLENHDTEEYKTSLMHFDANSEIKVVRAEAGTNKIWYPEGDNCTINDAGEYTIYFRPKYDGDDNWFKKCIFVKPVNPEEDIFSGHSVTLEGDIGVNCYLDTNAVDLDVEEIASGNEEVSVSFEWDTDHTPYTSDLSGYDAVIGQDNYDEYLYEDGRLKISCNTAVAEMSCDIKITVTVGDESYTEKYSVRDYCLNILNAPEGTFDDQDKLVTLVKRMLDYGAKTQDMFGVDAAPANEGVDMTGLEMDADADMLTQAINAANQGIDYNSLKNVDSALGLEYNTVSVVFLSESSLRVYYRVVDPAAYEAAKKDGAFSVTPHEEKLPYIYFEFTNIAPAEMDSYQNFSISGDNFYYSVLNYARLLLNNSNSTEQQVAVAKAAYWYNIAANDYFG